MGKKIAVDTSIIDGDLVAEIKAHQKWGLVQTDGERKAFLKTLKSKDCAHGLRMWAALFGTLEMKQAVAKNPTYNLAVLKTLMLDCESAPWYVLRVMRHRSIFRNLIIDLYGKDTPDMEIYSLDHFIGGYLLKEWIKKPWLEFIPESGTANVLQAELIRILNNFGYAWWKGLPYDLRSDEEKYVTLEFALDSLESISLFSKNILKALLRLEQMTSRSFVIEPPGDSGEACGSYCQPVVDVFLRRNEIQIPFVANY